MWSTPQSRNLAVVSLLAVMVAIGFFLLHEKSPSEDIQQPVAPAATEAVATTRADYEPLTPMMVGDVPVFASIADTDSERALGLSGTTMLPEDVVKFFVFPYDQRWSFWMKDMTYPIDILWLDSTGTVVHRELAVSPDTYPHAFSPSVDARYVVETVSGFASKHGIEVGASTTLPAI